MTQEDKQLVLRDIRGRLPYVVMGLVRISNGYDYNMSITGGDIDLLSRHFVTIKPYLRPMSSMTEEEMEELLNIDKKRGLFSSRHLTWHIDGEIIDYLNKKMFDWRGLIPMGLALEAPEGMYNI